ncbi:hypothetical protein HYPGJ_31613 [Hyphomicrobium sp. GJ21]|uniref:hypothetical protein n=1 Tax=Hyphomicrobium sp. GJ21 TaxID=113574 RepID=UPI000622BB1D|nr:hypothetical protein [Hyphomicrobium sp. GJ21]CEJ88128.1 hypothetical protein HYPGJ_31613 [Hyphomicrobium sp. GJ21]
MPHEAEDLFDLAFSEDKPPRPHPKPAPAPAPPSKPKDKVPERPLSIADAWQPSPNLFEDTLSDDFVVDDEATKPAPHPRSEKDPGALPPAPRPAPRPLISFDIPPALYVVAALVMLGAIFVINLQSRPLPAQIQSPVVESPAPPKPLPATAKPERAAVPNPASQHPVRQAVATPAFVPEAWQSFQWPPTATQEMPIPTKPPDTAPPARPPRAPSQAALWRTWRRQLSAWGFAAAADHGGRPSAQLEELGRFLFAPTANDDSAADVMAAARVVLRQAVDTFPFSPEDRPPAWVTLAMSHHQVALRRAVADHLGSTMHFGGVANLSAGMPVNVYLGSNPDIDVMQILSFSNPCATYRLYFAWGRLKHQFTNRACRSGGRPEDWVWSNAPPAEMANAPHPYQPN